MDREHFDQLTRALAGTSSRRRVSALVLGIGSLAGLSRLGLAEAEAKTKKAKRRKRKHKHKHGQPAEQPQPEQPQPQQPVCVPNCVGKECGPDGCGGECGQCPILLPICNSLTQTCEPLVVFP